MAPTGASEEGRLGVTGRLARVCAAHPWRAVGAWVALAVVSVGITSAFLGDSLTTESDFVGTPESQRAVDLIEQRLDRKEPVRDVVIVRSATQTVDQAEFRQQVEAIRSRLVAAAPGVVRIGPTYYDSQDPSQVSKDGHSTLIQVTMPGSELNDAPDRIKPVIAAVDWADGQGGFAVLITGQATVGDDFTKLSESDLQKGEGIGIPIALLILVAVFGAVVAAFVPLILTIFAIVVALALAALIGQISPLSFFVVNMLTFMGLAVGIDYSLFIVSRYRDERREGHAKHEAIGLAGRTASRAVLFSGMTVVLALVGMLIVPTKIFVSLAAGAILVVLVAVVAALTLLPAIISLLGDGIERLRVPYFGRRDQTSSDTGGFWGRIVAVVMRHPVVALVLSVIVLLIAAVPYFSIHTGSAGLATLPDSTHAKQGYVALNREFTVGEVTPATIVVDGDVVSADAREAFAKLQAALAKDDRFGPLQPASDSAPDLAVINVPVAGDPNSDSALDAVRALRDTYLPDALAGTDLNAYVTGASAQNLDYFAITDQYLPIVFALVLA